METAIVENYAYHRSRGMPASTALRVARQEVRDGKRRYGACNPCIDFNPPTKAGARFVENVEDGLRLVGYADEIAKKEGHWRSIDHTGWFTDEDCDSSQTYRGVVYRLPHRAMDDSADERLYAVGYADPCNEGAALLEFGRFSSLLDAAKAADHFAEHEAAEAREYNEAWHAGRDYYERLPEELAEIRRRFLTLAAKSHTIGRDAANTRWLEEIAEEWEQKRKERQELYDTFHRQPGFEE